MNESEYPGTFESRMEEMERQALGHRVHEWIEESHANYRELAQAYMHGIVDALNQAAAITEWYNDRDPIDIAAALRAVAGRKEDGLPEMFRQLRFGDERLYSRDVLYRVVPGFTSQKLAAMTRRRAIAPDFELPEDRRCVGYRWQTVQAAFDLGEEWRSRFDEAADALAKEDDNLASFRQTDLDDHVRAKRLSTLDLVRRAMQERV